MEFSISCHEWHLVLMESARYQRLSAAAVFHSLKWDNEDRDV
jgi:hypothetical protein